MLNRAAWGRRSGITEERRGCATIVVTGESTGHWGVRLSLPPAGREEARGSPSHHQGCRFSSRSFASAAAISSQDGARHACHGGPARITFPSALHRA